MAKASITFKDVAANEDGRNIEVLFEAEGIEEGAAPTKAQHAAFAFFELISDMVVADINSGAEKAE